MSTHIQITLSRYLHKPWLKGPGRYIYYWQNFWPLIQSSMPEYIAWIILFCNPGMSSWKVLCLFLLVLPRSTNQNYSLNISDSPPFCTCLLHLLLHDHPYTVYRCTQYIQKEREGRRKTRFYNKIEKSPWMREKNSLMVLLYFFSI